jgi:hypothetical protein
MKEMKDRKQVSKSNIIRILFLVLSLFILLVACSPNVGGTKWVSSDPEEKDMGVILEFFKDNTWKMMDSTGKWVVLDDGRIKMDYTSFGMTQAFFAKISGNKLSLEMAGKKFGLVKGN